MALELADRYSFCIANHRAVLLDLSDGSYVCLRDEIDRAFCHLAEGGKGTDDVIRTLQPLLDEDVLFIKAGGRGLPGRPAITPALTSLFDEIEHELPLAPNLVDIAARVATEWTVDRRPLHKTLSRLSPRRMLPARSIDDPRVQALIRAYLATRRWIVTQDRCLPWSAALVKLLRHNGLDARLIVGVRTAPFGAHAWAQFGGIVLNDSLDRVIPYTPILAA